MNGAGAAENSACVTRYVDTNGKAGTTCALQGASSKPEDAAVLEAELKTALPAAWKAHDGAALDACVKRSETQFLSVLQADCTKTCTARAPNVLAVQRQGSGLVTTYKRCMVAADSTPEARKLNAYETDLYCDYLRKANERCRTSARCDWVEGYSDLQCTYASPGVTCGF